MPTATQTSEAPSSEADSGAWDSSKSSGLDTDTDKPVSRTDEHDSAQPADHIEGAGLDGALVCDCSICLKHLSVFSIQPVERVKYIKGCVPGEGTLKVYMFGEKKGRQCVRVCPDCCLTAAMASIKHEEVKLSLVG